MSHEQWSAVDQYISSLFVAPDMALESALETSAAAGLPAINVAPNQGKLLYLIALIHKPSRVLEIGTLGGYSTIWLARALQPGGRLISLEADPKHAEVARTNIANAGLGRCVEVLEGPALETLPKLDAERRGPFDLIFIDADKPAYPEYFGWALKLSRPGTVFIADNVIRQGGVIDPASEDPRVRGVRRFNELVAAEGRVNATAIQTVGIKGYDGFVIGIIDADVPRQN